MPRGNVDLETRIQRIEASLASLAMALLKSGRADEAIQIMQISSDIRALRPTPEPHRKVS